MKAKVIFIPDDFEMPADFDTTKVIKPAPTEKIIKPRKPYTPKPRLDTKEIKLSLSTGNKCARCGYNEFLSALCYHHTDPSIKSATVSTFISRYASTPTPENWQRIIDEISKCIVLCANCHNALHAGDWSI